MWMITALALATLAALWLRSRSVTLPALDQSWLPPAVGIVWALFALLAWGTLHPLPLFHDEASYLLEARLLASGRWSAAPPPSPEFFAMPHVLTEPVLTSKYPPGHALLLAIGQGIGTPLLIVFLLNAVRAGLTFALVRRLSGGWTALLTVVLLGASPGQRRWSASFFSEITSGACLLAAWWALLRWRETRRSSWLGGVALALGWCAITRPWSALAFAIPIAFVVLRDVKLERRWRQLAYALAAGTVVLGVLPLWAYQTTGNWRDTPLARYARDYMPYDYPHFGMSTVTPRREESPDVAAIGASLREVERSHTLPHLPVDAAKRLYYWIGDLWPSASLLFLALFALGVRAAPAPARVGMATLGAVFIAYLAHPTWPQWTLYYFEVAPAALYFAALGVTSAAGWLVHGGWPRSTRPDPRLSLVAAAMVLVLLPANVMENLRTGRALTTAMQPMRKFAEQVVQLPDVRSIVFVRFGPTHSAHDVTILGDPDWMTARSWIVLDRGLDDARLASLAPDRQPYIYDQGTNRFVRISSPSGAR